jgi:hypothetical protein
MMEVVDVCVELSREVRAVVARRERSVRGGDQLDGDGE